MTQQTYFGLKGVPVKLQFVARNRALLMLLKGCPKSCFTLKAHFTFAAWVAGADVDASPDVVTFHTGTLEGVVAGFWEGPW